MARYPEEGVSLEAMGNRLADCGESPVNFEVGAFAGETLVGEFGVAQVRPHIKYRHRAVMGISVRKEYWGCGLGSYLMQLAIDQTRANGFEQLELGVYSDNSRAIHLYEKFGFERYGIQPRAFKLKDGTYRDEIIMVKMLSPEQNKNAADGSEAVSGVLRLFSQQRSMDQALASLLCSAFL